jgi:hypothetical protein
MNSVENIKKIADKNKVSFEDLLCHLIEEIEAEEKLKTESQKK